MYAMLIKSSDFIYPFIQISCWNFPWICSTSWTPVRGIFNCLKSCPLYFQLVELLSVVFSTGWNTVRFIFNWLKYCPLYFQLVEILSVVFSTGWNPVGDIFKNCHPKMKQTCLILYIWKCTWGRFHKKS